MQYPLRRRTQGNGSEIGRTIRVGKTRLLGLSGCVFFWGVSVVTDCRIVGNRITTICSYFVRSSLLRMKITTICSYLPHFERFPSIYAEINVGLLLFVPFFYFSGVINVDTLLFAHKCLQKSAGIRHYVWLISLARAYRSTRCILPSASRTPPAAPRAPC